MAITRIHPHIPGGTGTAGMVGKNRITVQYRIVAGQFDDPVTLANDPLFPVAPFAPHPSLASLTARSFNFTRISASNVQSEWTVQIEYSDEPISAADKEKQEQSDPTLRGLKLEVYSAAYGKLVTKDRNGQLMLTSAGEPYPAYEIDDDRWVISGERNYAAGSIPSWAWEYQHKLNAASITVKGRVLDAETCKMSSIRISPIQLENATLFETLRFEIQYRRGGWKAERLDAGFYYVNSDGEYDDIVIKGKRPTTEQLLDGNGNLLIDNLGHDPPIVAGDETYNEFDVYETADYSVIDFTEAS
jgi:hypothetical protein